VRETEANPSDASGAELFTSLYTELRRIAAAQMARAGGAWTLQPTALVHEAWLRLTGTAPPHWRSQSHFVASATEAMRHILIDRARRRRAVRNGGGQQRIDIDLVDSPWCVNDDEEMLALDAALEKFAAQHPDAAALIKLQCFGGLDVVEAGRVLGLTRSVAYRPPGRSMGGRCSCRRERDVRAAS
jgi:RNA polymerase sigma factor (TIGR02999 family)